MRSLILITDSIPSANGAGISQTLYNLLDGWDSFIYIISRLKETIPTGELLNAEIIPYRYEKYQPWQNRLGKWFNPTALRLNFEAQELLKFPAAKWPSAVDSIVLVSTTEPIKLHLAFCMLQHGYSVIPYFMDDWLAGSRLNWKGGNIHRVAKKILEAAPCWLMISRHLEEIMRNRYSLERKPVLVIHNPAPALSTTTSGNHKTFEPNQLSVISHHQIVYAGSIWPMHADALIATARAIHLLHEKGLTSFSLTIYTGEIHWKKYQRQLQGAGVEYGGWKAYKEIHKYLTNAWLLLCTASFAEEYQAFSDSSVQTKLTDYIAVGKPVLFVGPTNAASAVFVEEQDIGFTIETNQPEDIAARLEAISRMTSAYARKAIIGQQLANTTFSKKSVQQNLYRFLEKYTGVVNELIES